MSETQVDNVQEESTLESAHGPNSPAMSSEDFFSDLENSVNAGIIEKESVLSTSQESGNTVEESRSEVQPQNEIDVLQKRYSDSSREGKRLNQRLGELEPYVPIIDAMKQDPNLVSHVRSYFEGGGQAPKNMKTQLGLDEEFVFDPDEAISDPASDSAKVLNTTIDGVVQRRLGSTLSQQKEENRKLSTESEFRKKHSMSDDDWFDFQNFAKGNKLSLDDILFLKNRTSRENNIANNARNQVATQMKDVQSRPRSLATTGSQEVESSVENKVFDTILGIDSKLENAFG